MPPIPAQAALVAHRYQLPGDAEDMLITYGVEFEGDVPPGQDVVNNLDAGWKTHLDAVSDSTYVLVGTMLWLNNGGTDPEVWASTNATAPGTLSGTALPPNNALLVTKLTGLAGRRNRGRLFIPGVQAAAVSEAGLMSAPTVAGFQTAVSAWFESIDAPPLLPGDEGRYMVILHSDSTHWEIDDGQPRRVPNGDPIPAPTRITGLRVEPRIATQRRRLRP